MLLFLLGLVAGGFVQSMANPRLGVSAHVGAVMTGTFLAVVGLLWRRLRLAPGAAAVTFWSVLYGSWASSVGLFFAGVFGTSRSTPLAGAGHSGTPAEEAVVNLALTSGAVAMLVAGALLLWGLRGREAVESSNALRPTRGA